MKKLLFIFALLQPLLALKAQQDSVPSYSVGVILPFYTGSAMATLNDIDEATDVNAAGAIRLPGQSVTALSFYQGLTEALQQNKDNAKFKVYAFDCNGSDSVTEEILKDPLLKKMDVIIGPVSTTNGKPVAAFCKQNRIINIQPFTPSKSLGEDNPYHIKLAPTIHVHIDNMFQSILDSFTSANVIIYSPDNDIALLTANRFDSLFADYNKTAGQQFTVTMVKSDNMMVNGKKVKLSELVSKNQRNIWIITAFDDVTVNESLRQLFDKKDNTDIIVYGMPTWMDGDITRLDYVNDYHARISRAFYADTTKGRCDDFIASYKDHYSLLPDETAYLGYDVMGFTARCLATYGKDFPGMITTQRYTGLGYIFDIMKEENADGSIDYYENRHVNVFVVDNYQLKKIW